MCEYTKISCAWNKRKWEMEDEKYPVAQSGVAI